MKSIFLGSSTRKSDVLELVHMDVCGPIEVKAFSSCSYFVTFIDNASKKVWAYVLKSKGNKLDIFKDFHVVFERETGKLLKCLEATMVVSIWVPYSPQLSGVAERMNRLTKRIQSMLSSVKLANWFSGEA